MAAANGDPAPICPSARPELAGAVDFSVVGGTAQQPRLAQLVQPRPVTAELPAAVDGLPACRIRPWCRWWQQEGKDARESST
jgi:hypothetical protein